MSYNFNGTFVRSGDGLVIQSTAWDNSTTQWQWTSPTDQICEGRILPTNEFAFYFNNQPTMRAVLMNCTQALPIIFQVQNILGRTVYTYSQISSSGGGPGSTPTNSSVRVIPPVFRDSANKNWAVSGITTTLFNATCSDGRKAVVYFALYPNPAQTPNATYSVYVKFYSSANVLIDFQRGQGNSSLNKITFDSDVWNKYP